MDSGIATAVNDFELQNSILTSLIAKQAEMQNGLTEITNKIELQITIANNAKQKLIDFANGVK